MKYIINHIDWEKVAYCIVSKDNTDISEWIEKQKSSMFKRLTLIEALAIPYLICDFWEIRYTKTAAAKFEIKFQPFEFTASPESENIQINEELINNREWKFLHQLLQVYSEKQEYEKCHLLKERLQEMTEEG